MLADAGDLLHEQSFNNALAYALKQRREAWRNDDDSVISERLAVLVENPALRPDILVRSPNSYPIAVEVEFGDPAIEDARKRLGKRTTSNLLPIRSVIAIGVPNEVRTWSSYKLNTQLESQSGINLNFVLLTANVTEEWTDVKDSDIYTWPESGYVTGNINDLAYLCETATAPTSLVEQETAKVAREVNGYANALKQELSQSAAKDIAQILGQTSIDQAMRLACCIWMTSFRLHDLLAATGTMSHKGLKSIAAMRQASGGVITLSDIRDAWSIIWKINYRSVFTPALKALHPDLPTLRGAEILDGISRLAERVTALRLGNSIDFAGELFPKLLDDREETAAHYTLVTTAELLASLAVQRLKVSNWSNADEVQNLRIADLSCGTGTLLRTAYSGIRRSHEGAGGQTTVLHQSMMEHGITGIDINSLASHMTAAGLSSIDIGIQYQQSNIGAVAIAGGKTGSLELLEADQISDVTGHIALTATAENPQPTNFEVPNESQDLIIQNPPYLRPRAARKLFDVAGIQEHQRKRSIDKLSQLRNRLRRAGNDFSNGQAGLASDFCALADMKLKSEGIFATVLPLTAAHAESWRGARKEIEKRHTDITAIAFPSDDRAMLSDETYMNEMLLISRKKNHKNNSEDAKTTILAVNLYHAPNTIPETAYIAKAITEAENSQQENGEINIAGKTIGTWVRMSIIRSGFPWYAVGMRDYNLATVTAKLMKGKLWSPRDIASCNINLNFTCLDQLAKIGPTHHLIGHIRGGDTIGAFTFDPITLGDIAIHPALWAANAQTQRNLIVDPTHNGIPVPGRIDQQHEMIANRSNLFISRNFRMTSQSLAAAWTNKPVMGGSAWTALMTEDESLKRAILIWCNSTLGMIIRWGYAQTTQPGRATMQIKALHGLPIPDFAANSDAGGHARRVASQRFDELAKLQIQPASFSFQDTSRHRIDEAALEMLGLADDQLARRAIQDIRRMWCREPSVHGRTRRIMQALRIQQ